LVHPDVELWIEYCFPLYPFFMVWFPPREALTNDWTLKTSVEGAIMWPDKENLIRVGEIA